MAVSLNVDLGEREDEPEELYSFATVVNVACGGHAGDARSIERALRAAHRAGTSVAAHPSYADRAGFGRTSLPFDRARLSESLRSQLTTLQSQAQSLAVSIVAVKPHGALYHDAAQTEEVAEVVFSIVREVFGHSIAFVGPPGGRLERRVVEAAAPYWREGFADRTYRDDGRLLPRGEKGAVIDEPSAAAAQALTLARSGRYDTICVHGDTPNAVEIAEKVRATLEARGELAR